MTRYSTERLLMPALVLAAVTLALPVAAQVSDIYRINDGRFAAKSEDTDVNLPPGKELLLSDLRGPGKVVYFYFTDDGEWTKKNPMYPGLVLEVYWDEATQPSIRVPLWSFFGAFEHTTIDYQSALMQINHYCYMSYLPMPFSKRARFVLLNDGDQTYSHGVAWGIDYERNTSFESESSRLHVAWSHSKPAHNQASLHPMLNITGKGQYIGNFLQVNTDYKGWWGEGDTIFDVDGEKVVHSPGTEDEYGSTWTFEHTYSYLHSGYIQMSEGRNRMYRWYVANPVRFQKSLRVQIQDWRVEKTSKGYEEVPSKDESDDFTSVVFWYQEGAHAAPGIPPYAERVGAGKSSAATTTTK